MTYIAVICPHLPLVWYNNTSACELQINVEQFFNLFISDDAVGFIKSFHNKCGDKGISLSIRELYAVSLNLV